MMGVRSFAARSLRMIREALGDFPLVGYCSEAEVHRNVRHTHAGLLTLFEG